MVATRQAQDSVMRDLADTMARAYDTNGQPREGFYNLTRRMENEAEEQFDVDHTVSDFLVYKTTADVFEWQASANKWESDLPDAMVTMTADWRTFMSHKHQGRRFGSLAAFRSRLLQFVLLLTHRYHPSQTWTNAESLQALRDKNLNRSRIWQDSHDFEEINDRRSPFSDGEVDSARRRRASALHLPSSFDSEMFSDRNRPSLHELLPLFVELTAARTSLGDGDEWQPISDWYKLAGQFMLQATIDQYLINSECRPEVMASIFSFGSMGAEHEHSEGSDIASVRTVFCKDDHPDQEFPEWTTTRSRYLREASAIDNLEGIEARHSYASFEKSLLEFLHHLHESAVKPDLVQVKEKRFNINGVELLEAESEAMYQRMRL